MSRPVPARSSTVRLGAPLLGINGVGDMEHLEEGECVDGYNVCAGERGLKTRPGYQYHHTAVTMSSKTIVRSILPFKGLTSAADKVFATTQAGIMDVTTSADTPGTTWSFPAATAPTAGYGNSISVDVGSTKYLLYCDDAYGLYIWNGTTWARGQAGTAQPWLPSTDFLVGERVLNDTYKTYECITAGTSDTSGGPTGTAADITDGTVHWEYVGGFDAWVNSTGYVLGDRVTNDSGKTYVNVLAGTSAGSGGPTGTGAGISDGTCAWDYVGDESKNFGPSLASQRAGLSLNPAKFVFACVWKSRVFFVEADSGRAWYSQVGSLYGPYTHFNFGYRARVGGPLVALANWSFDAGAGLDTLLCAFTQGGDVVVYQGTDPDYADSATGNTFGLKGVWNVGPLTAGRRVVSEWGGELLVLSSLGVVSMSKLLQGKDASAANSQGAQLSWKVSNLFSANVTAGASIGSSLIIDPVENVLLCAICDSSGLATTTLAMSLATGGWYQWNLPFTCFGILNGVVYAGDKSSRVSKLTPAAGLDAVARAGTGGNAIRWNVLWPFAGGYAHMTAMLARVSILASESNPLVHAVAHWDFDKVIAAPSTTSSATVISTLTPSHITFGLTGTGRHLALEARGYSKSRTIIVGADVVLERGVRL